MEERGETWSQWKLLNLLPYRDARSPGAAEMAQMLQELAVPLGESAHKEGG